MSDPQPLDAGIIKNVKHLYTKCIVRRYLAQKDPGKLTLLDAMHYLNASWESLTRKTVNNCFRTSRHSPEVEEREPCANDDMDEELQCAGAGQVFSDFVAVDNNVPTSDTQTVADIEEHEPETPPAVTFARAMATLDVLLRHPRQPCSRGGPADAAERTLPGKRSGSAPAEADGHFREERDQH
ncbi:hypothetical protein HPB47_020534 [Ixodes persulcatus]|uniref:Uncharacterized protein n=1 Tax=Ixodes persulcatus TaxID=34615 RepID=A0AC60QHB2_IXOPE|nr:hypothetical protein HPB47_020534 [Ixodes persulcatus]